MKVTSCLVSMAAAFLLAALLGCSDVSAGPSDSTIHGCILDAIDHPAIGVERKNVAMGMEIGSTIIDHIAINGVFDNGGGWIVNSVITIGSKDVFTTAEDVAATARMFGFQQKNGYLLQDVEVDYLFEEERNGWSCYEL